MSWVPDASIGIPRKTASAVPIFPVAALLLFLAASRRAARRRARVQDLDREIAALARQPGVS